MVYFNTAVLDIHRVTQIHTRGALQTGQHETQKKNWMLGVLLNGTLPLKEFPGWSRDSNV